MREFTIKVKNKEELRSIIEQVDSGEYPGGKVFLMNFRLALQVALDHYDDEGEHKITGLSELC